MLWGTMKEKIFTTIGYFSVLFHFLFLVGGFLSPFPFFFLLILKALDNSWAVEGIRRRVLG